MAFRFIYLVRPEIIYFNESSRNWLRARNEQLELKYDSRQIENWIPWSRQNWKMNLTSTHINIARVFLQEWTRKVRAWLQESVWRLIGITCIKQECEGELSSFVFAEQDFNLYLNFALSLVRFHYLCWSWIIHRHVVIAILSRVSRSYDTCNSCYSDDIHVCGLQHFFICFQVRKFAH